MIHFNIPPYSGKELEYIAETVKLRKLSGDGPFTKKCNEWIEQRTGAARALLTTSCTHALEMAALLCGIGPGDEVILPSYTFCSTADAFVQRGARLVFVDIRPDTMNLDENLIEEAVTPRTKVVAPVHYAGVSCRMDRIIQIADKYRLKVVEDAAQGVLAEYGGKALGAIGDFGCFSFHETKNYSCGEGGALLMRDAAWQEQAEIIREKGTNRSKFYRGQIDKYTWIGYGSSYLPSELNAAYLWAQLEVADRINEDRLASWRYYHAALRRLAEQGLIGRPEVPEGCRHNAHMYWIKAKDLDERTRLIAHLKQKGVETVFHYVPLHSSPAGLKFGRFHGADRHTTRESERLLRLPMHYGLAESDLEQVVAAVEGFYRG